jgi:hypothetical protein
LPGGPVVGCLTKHFVLGFGKLVKGGLDEVTFEMVHVFVPVIFVLSKDE